MTRRSAWILFSLTLILGGCGRSQMEDDPGMFSDGMDAPPPECVVPA